MKHIEETLKIAKELKVSLKNIKTFPGHDGMLGFNADIYIDNKKTLHVYDDAYGGIFNYTPIKQTQTYKDAHNIKQEINNKIKQYPPITIHLSNKTIELREDLDGLCAALVSEWEWNKKIKRDQKKGLLIEIESGNGYDVLAWKQYGTIPKMIDKLGEQSTINLLEMTIKKQLKQKKRILNKDYLISVGVKEW